MKICRSHQDIRRSGEKTRHDKIYHQQKTLPVKTALLQVTEMPALREWGLKGAMHDQDARAVH